jgi:hypothetical protein
MKVINQIQSCLTYFGPLTPQEIQSKLVLRGWEYRLHFVVLECKKGVKNKMIKKGLGGVYKVGSID